MGLTREFIESKLKDAFIANGTCGTRAFEVAGDLVGRKIKAFNRTEYSSSADVLKAVREAIKNESIAIVWLDTGWVTEVPPERAIHCFFVFQENPLMMFTLYENPGPDYSGEDRLDEKVNETIANIIDKCVGVHVIPIADPEQTKA